MKLIAHRGDSAHHQENTPHGWDAAFAAGAYAIEADIRFSADGVGICSHDATLERVFGRPDRPADLTIAELERLEGHGGGRLARLAEVLAYARAGRAVLLDLKDETPNGLERLWGEIATEVPEARRQLVIAGCHTLDAVRFLLGRGVEILGFIPDPELGPQFFEAGAPIIRLWERDVSAGRVAALSALGAALWVTAGGTGIDFMTGDTAAANLTRLADAGVAGVLVNDIAFAKTALENGK